MKTLLQAIVKRAIIRLTRPSQLSRHKKDGRADFEAAPSYWAMIPVPVNKIRIFNRSIHNR